MWEIKRRAQYQLLTGLSVVVIVLTMVLSLSSPHLFLPYFGSIHPLLVVAITVLLGFLLLPFLLLNGWFVIYRKGNHRGFLYAGGLATLLATVMILIDWQVVFPEDMNAPFPESLLFYPAIGFVVEILFHVLPLALLLVFFTSIFKKARAEKIIWPVLFFVAMLEPAYQSVLSTSGAIPLWAGVYVGIHIFLINLSQLVLFKRYDFVTMYAFRLVYYFCWHIVWGSIRLELLF